MLSIVAVSLLALSSLATGQVTQDPNTGTFTCARQNAAYCAGASLTSNIIIRCNGFVGQPGNCNDNLAGVPPVGVKTSALCYQSSDTAGDAQCSFGGNIFPNGTAVPIPSAGGSNTTSIILSTITYTKSSTGPRYTNTSTTIIPVSNSTTDVVLVASSSSAQQTIPPQTATTTLEPSSAPGVNTQTLTSTVPGAGSGAKPTTTGANPVSTSPPNFTGVGVVNQASAVLASLAVGMIVLALF